MFKCETLRHAMLFYLQCRPDSPRAFSVSNWPHAAVACTGGIWAGGFDPFLANRFQSGAERRAVRANRRRGRQRQASSPRAWSTWAGTAIVRREATCWSVPLAWKNGALTFSMDYKGTGKAMQRYLLMTASQTCSQMKTVWDFGASVHEHKQSYLSLCVLGRHTYIHVYCCSIIKEARKCHRAGSSENKQPVLLEVWHEGRFVS